MGEIHRFFSFYVKISQNWLKFLDCTQNFAYLHLKNVKMLLKNYFTKLCASFVVKNRFERNFFSRINRFLV